MFSTCNFSLPCFFGLILECLILSHPSQLYFRLCSLSHIAMITVCSADFIHPPLSEHPHPPSPILSEEPVLPLLPSSPDPAHLQHTAQHISVWDHKSLTFLWLLRNSLSHQLSLCSILSRVSVLRSATWRATETRVSTAHHIQSHDLCKSARTHLSIPRLHARAH